MNNFFLILIFAGTLLANETGREIAEKANATQRNFIDEKVETTMYLINANKDTVTRNLRNMTIERPNSEDYSIIQFLNPADVRGTGLLTYQNPAGDDKQWLYLPELRRVKKISSKNKSGAFMGSEFAYEDISGNTLDKFEYELVSEEIYDGKDCYILQRTPVYENSGYLRIKTWYAKDSYLMLRSEYTDRKNSLLKVLTLKGWEKYPSGTWRASEMRMQNLQSGKVSILHFNDRQMKTGLQVKDFNKRSLQRILK
ncbi:MAG: outer membrane lipoprotein-sorting protein [Calditrichaeota bacterium]|nr:MAG: outer membrane lipoprotein-sorting protein [Calditrichota bacterium]